MITTRKHNDPEGLYPKIYDIRRRLGGLVFLFSLFPWVTFGLNKNDSQPWAFLWAIAYLSISFKRVRIPPYSEYLVISIIFGLLFALLRTDSLQIFLAVRAVIGYISIPLFYVVFYDYFSRHSFPSGIAISATILWLLAGIFEFYLPSIGGFISAARTTPDRGVTSFAPEPTYFATYLFFISWILLEAGRGVVAKRSVKVLLVANFFGVLLLAQSTAVLTFYFFALIMFLSAQVARLRIQKRRLVKLAFFAVAMLAGCYMALKYLDGLRVHHFISTLSSGSTVVQIAYNDASINQRVEAVYFSVLGGLHNHLAPGGFSSFVEKRDLLLACSGDFFWHLTGSNKIMSWIGSFFYELGGFGLLALVLIFLRVYRPFRGSFFYFLTLFSVLLSAVPVAFPLVPMLFALLALKARKARSKIECPITEKAIGHG